MCINLRRDFGHRYKVEYERDRMNERGDESRMYIQCKHGTIAPYGDSQLAATVDDPKIAKHLSTMPAITEDIEDVFVFDPFDFDQIAAVMKPTRR